MSISKPSRTKPPGKLRSWAMLIDLNVCTGCSACVVACRAENNIPITGAAEAARNGTIQWLHIDRGWSGGQDDFHVETRLITCQQCDAAPCEPVCPVLATYTNSEGLCVQVYNRCVGTRYCALNCPYDQRFFNWFDYRWPAPMEVQLNPDVSRRTRGVMEKCSFCSQRVLAAERAARSEGRPLREDEVQPACVQSCPAQALLFGDLADPDSLIARAWRRPGLETLLEELGTLPRVRYGRRQDLPAAEALQPGAEDDA
jgi:molybdopterin-containing oxidoreductase family iron-sulfur binding subunit